VKQSEKFPRISTDDKLVGLWSKTINKSSATENKKGRLFGSSGQESDFLPHLRQKICWRHSWKASWENLV